MQTVKFVVKLKRTAFLFDCYLQWNENKSPSLVSWKNANFFFRRDYLDFDELTEFIVVIFFMIRRTKYTQLNTCFQFTQISVQIHCCSFGKQNRSEPLVHTHPRCINFFSLESWIKWKYKWWEDMSEGARESERNTKQQQQRQRIEAW